VLLLGSPAACVSATWRQTPHTGLSSSNAGREILPEPASYLILHLYLIYYCCCSVTWHAAATYSLTPLDPLSELAAIKSCLASLQLSFYTNGMALNPDKSRAIVFGTAQRVQSFNGVHSVDVAGQPLHWTLISSYLELHCTPICLCPSTLSSCDSPVFIIFVPCITYVVLDLPIATALVSALISSRLDYANSVLYSSSSFAHLHRAQNAAARVITQNITLDFGRYSL